MRLALKWFVLPLILGGLFADCALAEDSASLTLGGDAYAAAQHNMLEQPVSGDAFLVGYDVSIDAPVAGAAHAAGFNVTSDAEVGDDLYAAGFNVEIRAPVARNVTAAASTVTLDQGASVGGNARLTGATVNVGGPIEGALLVSSGHLKLYAPISGDVSFYGESIDFRPGAKVGGTFFIHAPHPIEVPASVAATAQIVYEPLESPDYMSEAGRTADNIARGFWPAIWALVIWFVLLLLAGVALIALLPRRLERMEQAMRTGMAKCFGVGILVFAMMLGFVPLTAMTLIGILALPVVLLAVVIAGSLAFMTGSFLIGLRFSAAFAPIDSNLRRLAVLAVSLVLAMVLAMVPFIGWLITLVLVTFGLGAAARGWGPGGSTANTPIAPEASTPLPQA